MYRGLSLKIRFKNPKRTGFLPAVRRRCRPAISRPGMDYYQCGGFAESKEFLDKAEELTSTEDRTTCVSRNRCEPWHGFCATAE